MTNHPRETADRFESAARSGQDFSDVYSSIVEMQHSSRDFNSYSMQMFATNMMLQQRGLGDFDGDGNQDFILGAKNGMIYTADPTHQVVQARDKNFNVVNQMELPMPPLDFGPQGRTNCFPNHGDRFHRRDRDDWNFGKRDRGWEEKSCCPPQCCCGACSQRSPLMKLRREGMDTGRSPLSNIYDNGGMYDGMPDDVPYGADTGRSPLSNVYDNGAGNYGPVTYDSVSSDRTVPDYSQFTGDGSVTNDGTLPSNKTVPSDGTLPSDGAVPSDGTVTNDGTIPNNGTASTDGAIPEDGTVDNGQLPAFTTSNDGTVKPYGMTYDGSVTTDGAVMTDGTVTPDGAVTTNGTVPSDGSVPPDGTTSSDGSVPLDGTTSSDGSNSTGQTYPIDPNS